MGAGASSLPQDVSADTLKALESLPEEAKKELLAAKFVHAASTAPEEAEVAYRVAAPAPAAKPMDLMGAPARRPPCSHAHPSLSPRASLLVQHK